MSKRDLLTADRLRELLSYDPDTGVFVWKVKRGGLAQAGTVAGTILTKGHRAIEIDDVLHAAHRLAWLYVYGEWPIGWLDHANNKPDDNRIANLRLATPAENARNRRTWSNRTLPKGVHRAKGGRTKPFEARIFVDGRLKHIGCFATVDDAKAAYLAAAKVHYGDFARSE